MTRDKSVAQFYIENANGGRAVLIWRRDVDGSLEPKLWICKFRESYVACDDAGPNSDDEPDHGFLVNVSPEVWAISVIESWRRHRNSVNFGRRVIRRKRSAA